MRDWYNTLHIIFSFLGGILSYFMGGYDLLIKTVFALTVFDYVTGVGQSIYNGTFSAKKCAKGIIKKVFIYCTIAISVVLQHFLGDTIPIREIVITFYIIYEGMSNLENIGKVIVYPEKLRNVFESLRESK